MSVKARIMYNSCSSKCNYTRAPTAWPLDGDANQQRRQTSSGSLCYQRPFSEVHERTRECHPDFPKGYQDDIHKAHLVRVFV
jgi:hypothetical protein